MPETPERPVPDARPETPGRPRPRTLVTGLAMGESPRWHDGRLWLSDWVAREILVFDADGHREVVTRAPTLPSCIDWLPDGRLVVVDGRGGRLLRLEPDGSLATHADLTGLSTHPFNDIAVSRRGDVYVNNVGFAFPGGEFAPGTVAQIRPDGTVRQAADGLAFPNGMVVTADDSTLIVAESYGSRLAAFDIAADGGLSGGRVWARLDAAAPDGICLDAEGAVWYGDVPGRCCVRVAEGGRVLQTVHLDRGCFACALGGPDGRTLYMVTADWSDPAAMMSGSSRTGQVQTLQVDVPRAA